MYSEENGRPSIDPVVLIKMELIQYLFGIPSMRRTAEEIKVNLAYRWFLGYGLTEETPHFSVVSKNYSRRFKDTDIFEKIFESVVLQLMWNKKIYKKSDSSSIIEFAKTKIIRKDLNHLWIV